VTCADEDERQSSITNTRTIDANTAELGLADPSGKTCIAPDRLFARASLTSTGARLPAYHSAPTAPRGHVSWERPNRGVDASALVKDDDSAAVGRNRKRIPDLGFQFPENAPTVPRPEHDHAVWR
jgi:hypothetical protein